MLNQREEKIEQIKGYLGLIVGWGQDRNLIKGSTPKAQLSKLVEETGEVAEAIADVYNVLKTKEDISDVLDRLKDGIGDSIVVATLLAAQYHDRDPKNNILLKPEYLLQNEFVIEEGLEQLGKGLEALQDKRPLVISDISGLIVSATFNMNYLLLTLGKISSRIGKDQPLEDGKESQYLQSFIFYLCVIAHLFDLDMVDCVAKAWNEIKDRKGKLVGGVFIKEANT